MAPIMFLLIYIYVFLYICFILFLDSIFIVKVCSLYLKINRPFSVYL